MLLVVDHKKKKDVLETSLREVDQRTQRWKIAFSHGKEHPYKMKGGVVEGGEMGEKGKGGGGGKGDFFPGMRVVFLARDPRDVAVSNYYDVTKR